MKSEVVKYFKDKSVFTGKVIEFALVRVPNEVVNVLGYKFHMDNYYMVYANDVKNPHEYIEPNKRIHIPGTDMVTGVDFNAKQAFRFYRKHFGLLQPETIKKARQRLGLSQADVAFILGMSSSNVSKVENGRVIQSVGEDTRFRVLLDLQTLSKLLRARIKTLKAPKAPKHPKSVNASNFEYALKVLDEIKDTTNQSR